MCVCLPSGPSSSEVLAALIEMDQTDFEFVRQSKVASVGPMGLSVKRTLDSFLSRDAPERANHSVSVWCLILSQSVGSCLVSR